MAESVEEKWLSSSYHEAGHGVVLVEFGHPITQVRIDVHTPWLGDPTSDGAVSTPHEIEELDDRGLIEMVVVFLAGGEAQAWWHEHYHGMTIGEARDYAYASGAADDLAGAQKCLKLVGANGRLARRLERTTQDMVAGAWDRIVEVAEALRESGGYLSGDDVYSLA
jgi:hypothetical protein